MNEIICKKRITYLLMIGCFMMGMYGYHNFSSVALAGTVSAADDQQLQRDWYIKATQNWSIMTWTEETTNNVLIPGTDGNSQNQDDLRDVASTRSNQQRPIENISPSKPNQIGTWYTVTVKWFSPDSDANRIVQYRFDNSNGDVDLLETFDCEVWSFDINAIWTHWEKWLCQLMPNSTNNVWINNLSRNTREYQARICLEKRKAVATKNIRSCYRVRNNYRDNFIFSPKN